MVSRRLFLQQACCAGAAIGLGAGDVCPATRTAAIEARFYRRLGGGALQCQLCFRQCVIDEGKRGFCRNRENRRGTLYSLAYGKASLQFDPIEKEPMFHNLPGTEILCTGTAGCNFRCRFCHNWHLSQRTVEELESYTEQVSAADVVALAQRKRVQGLSFTYNEPTVFYEFMHDVAKIGREQGLNTLCHTNGGMRPEPLRALLKHLRGVTVDLKGFTADQYRDASFAELTPVLDTLKQVRQEGKWLEVVNLLIPKHNDDPHRIREMCIWLKENLGPDVPLHFSRFFPAYKMKHLPPTPIRTLEEAHAIARREGIRYVYIGNVPGHEFNSTFCPRCKKKIISRLHFAVLDVALKNGQCKHCGYPVPGLWET